MKKKKKEMEIKHGTVHIQGEISVMSRYIEDTLAGYYFSLCDEYGTEYAENEFNNISSGAREQIRQRR